MKQILLLTFVLALNSNAQTNSNSDTQQVVDDTLDSKTEATTGDCDLKKLQIALTESTATPQQPKTKGQSLPSTSQNFESHSPIVLAVSNDPFGAPCPGR